MTKLNKTKKDIAKDKAPTVSASLTECLGTVSISSIDLLTEDL